MLWAILNKSWRQHPTKQQLYGHLPPITKTIKIRRSRHAGHCRRSRDELVRDVLLWTPSHGRVKAGHPVWTYIQQLCVDTGCSPEDLPKAMDDREAWRRRSGISVLIAWHDDDDEEEEEDTWWCSNTHTHSHKKKDTMNKYLLIQRRFADTRGFQGQSTQMEHSERQILELQRTHLVIFVLLMLLVTVLFLVTVISLPPRPLM